MNYWPVSLKGKADQGVGLQQGGRKPSGVFAKHSPLWLGLVCSWSLKRNSEHSGSSPHLGWPCSPFKHPWALPYRIHIYLDLIRTTLPRPNKSPAQFQLPGDARCLVALAVCEDTGTWALMGFWEDIGGKQAGWGASPMGWTAGSPQEQPGGHLRDGPHAPGPDTALKEGDVIGVEVEPLAPSETPGISCFVTELFLSSRQICFPEKWTKVFSL